jgi:hypothetical protein
LEGENQISDFALTVASTITVDEPPEQIFFFFWVFLSPSNIALPALQHFSSLL